MSRITASAHGKACSLRLPGCMGSLTVVLAHMPCVDKGMGLKSPDWWSAYACQHCHDVVDLRRKNPVSGEHLLHRMLAGIYETQKQLHEQGLLNVDR